MTAVVKYWICKRAPAFIYEAMECLGGNGYVEDSMLPRLYREAPVNAIWEGSGNVMCLDVLRALSREREAAQEVTLRIAERASGLPGVSEAMTDVQRVLASPAAEAHARFAVERLAAVAAIAALRGHAPAEVTDNFAMSQLGPRGSTFGSMRAPIADKVLERALPAT
jgi:putative acyl-CoA dehydrogenase